MENLGYYNGKFDVLESMSVPMLDRACYFGDGVYDATYVANHRIYCLDDHVDRLYRSAALLKINPPMSKEELKNVLFKMVQKVDSPDQFLYFQISRGTALRAHAFPEGMKSNLWIMIVPSSMSDCSGRWKLATCEDTRFFHCNVKTLNLIPNVMAATSTHNGGMDETVFHRGGRVTECAHSNVSILKNGVFRTAPTDCLILPGITRAHMIAGCHQLGIPVVEEAFSLEELFDADEVIVTSCGDLCQAAEEIDGKPVGGRDPENLARIHQFMFDEFHAQTNPEQK